MLTIHCPACRQPLSVPDAGQPYTCPRCKASVAPQAVTAPSAPTAPEPVDEPQEERRPVRRKTPAWKRPTASLAPEWLICLALTVLTFLLYAFTLSKQDSSPKEVATSAHYAVLIIVWYVIARAVSEIRRPVPPPE